MLIKLFQEMNETELGKSDISAILRRTKQAMKKIAVQRQD